MAITPALMGGDGASPSPPDGQHISVLHTHSHSAGYTCTNIQTHKHTQLNAHALTRTCTLAYVYTHIHIGTHTKTQNIKSEQAVEQISTSLTNYCLHVIQENTGKETERELLQAAFILQVSAITAHISPPTSGPDT